MKALILIALLALAACNDSITAPEPDSASIEITNGVLFDMTVEVRLGPCDARVETVAVLDPGEGHVAVVEPGCWRIAAFGTAPHGTVTALCGAKVELRAGETVRLRF